MNGKRPYGADEPERVGFLFRMGGKSVGLFLSGTEDAPDFDISANEGVGVDGRWLAYMKDGSEEGKSAGAKSIVG